MDNGLAKWVARQSESYQIRIFTFGVFFELLIMSYWLVCTIAPLTEAQLEFAKVVGYQLFPVFVLVPIFFYRKAKKDPVVPNEEETK